MPAEDRVYGRIVEAVQDVKETLAGNDVCAPDAVSDERIDNDVPGRLGQLRRGNLH